LAFTRSRFRRPAGSAFRLYFPLLLGERPSPGFRATKAPVSDPRVSVTPPAASASRRGLDALSPASSDEFNPDRGLQSVFERLCSVQVPLGTADTPEGPGALLAP
jgi:hypothetical protein